jgi:hypothetical protein
MSDDILISTYLSYQRASSKSSIHPFGPLCGPPIAAPASALLWRSFCFGHRVSTMLAKFLVAGLLGLTALSLISPLPKASLRELSGSRASHRRDCQEPGITVCVQRADDSLGAIRAGHIVGVSRQKRRLTPWALRASSASGSPLDGRSRLIILRRSAGTIQQKSPVLRL